MSEERETPADRHWPGFPGEEEAESYPVEDRGRYRQLLAMMLVPFVLAAIAVMIHGWHPR